MKIKREVKIGIFAVATLLALYWGFNFIKGSDMLGRNNTFYAVYDQVGGIQKASGIVVRGYKVGVVSDIIFDPSKSDKVVIEMSIRSKFKLPVDTKARIFSDGLLGGKAIELEFGTADTYLSSGDTLRSETSAGLLEAAGSEFESIKRKAGALVDDLTTTLANINSILTGNEAALTNTLSNLSRMSSTLNGVVQSQAGSIKGILSDMSALSGTLRSNTGRINSIIGNVEEVTGNLSEADLAATINNLASTLDEFNRTLAAANAGEGSLGKMLKDEALYDSLNTTAENLALLLEDIKEHPGRYVHISVFGKKSRD